MMGDIYPEKCNPCQSGRSLVPEVICSGAGECPHMKYFAGSNNKDLTLFEMVRNGKVVGRAKSEERLLEKLHRRKNRGEETSLGDQALSGSTEYSNGE